MSIGNIIIRKKMLIILYLVYSMVKIMELLTKVIEQIEKDNPYKLVFKGGTALSILHLNHHRESEDLDFDADIIYLDDYIGIRDYFVGIFENLKKDKIIVVDFILLIVLILNMSLIIGSNNKSDICIEMNDNSNFDIKDLYLNHENVYNQSDGRATREISKTNFIEHPPIFIDDNSDFIT